MFQRLAGDFRRQETKGILAVWNEMRYVEAARPRKIMLVKILHAYFFFIMKFLLKTSRDRIRRKVGNDTKIKYEKSKEEIDGKMK